MKICKVCKIEKPFLEFHKIKGCIGGVRNVCKECRKIENKEYKSKPHVIQQSKDYYQNNKESFRLRMNKHYHTLNGQYHQYKKRAKINKFEFDLIEEDCKIFYETLCDYCGGPIKGIGIDRVDPSIGYIKSNIVPCCSKCNYMKNTMTKEEFFNQLIKILEFNKIKL